MKTTTANKIEEIRGIMARSSYTLAGWTGPVGSLEAHIGAQVAGAQVSPFTAAATMATSEAESCRKSGDLESMTAFMDLKAAIRTAEALAAGRCTECGRKSDNLTVIEGAVCCADCAATF